MVDLALLLVDRESGLVAGRVRRVRACELAHLAVERRGEEHRLALLRQPRDDLVDLRLEAHVEHPVGLVEDEDPDAVERDDPPLDQVLQAARRRDEDVGLARGLRLRGDRDAAVDRGDPQVARRRDRAELGRDLGGELARRDEHERGRPPLGRIELLDERHGEGERLAGARRRLREHVAAGERVREDERLNSEWSVDVALRERLRDARGYAQLEERLHMWFRLLRNRSRLACPDRLHSCRENRRRTNLTGRHSAVRAHTVAAGSTGGVPGRGRR